MDNGGAAARGTAEQGPATERMTIPPPADYESPYPRPWWETRWFVAALIVLSAVPLLYPPNPPLVDLFGHLGRYRVQLEIDSSPWLSRYYGYEWKPIGNLGVDLLLIPLSKLLGLELTVKLIVLSIPAMMAAGFLWVAREVHHRLPPTAAFALPFAYSYPFHYGFANFSLSMAFAFLAFGFWLRLARLGKLRLRALLFIPISFVVFFTHTFGWGTLGLLCFSAEAVRQHDKGSGWLMSGPKAAMHAIVMILPALVILIWRSEVSGPLSRGWWLWGRKWEWVYSVLRDQWFWFDVGALILVALLLVYALFSRRLVLSRNLAFSALVLAAVFVMLPAQVFGSAFADMRLAPFVVVVFVLAIRFRAETHLPTARVLAMLALAFFLVRTAGTTASLAIASNDQQAKLEAIDHMPMGARVASLAGRACRDEWKLPRNGHLGAMVMVRRHGFSNDQWVIDGTNLLTLRSREAGLFSADPSQIVAPNGCKPRPWWIDRALARLPRDQFDYVWMIDAPSYDPALVAGMTPVWRGRGSVLYRIGP